MSIPLAQDLQHRSCILRTEFQHQDMDITSKKIQVTIHVNMRGAVLPHVLVKLYLVLYLILIFIKEFIKRQHQTMPTKKRRRKEMKKIPGLDSYLTVTINGKEIYGLREIFESLDLDELELCPLKEAAYLARLEDRQPTELDKENRRQLSIALEEGRENVIILNPILAVKNGQILHSLQIIHPNLLKIVGRETIPYKTSGGGPQRIPQVPDDCDAYLYECDRSKLHYIGTDVNEDIVVYYSLKKITPIWRREWDRQKESEKKK